MPTPLKQSTAFIDRIGPFVDATDGVTVEPSLVIAQADIQVSKDGGAFAQTSASSPTTTYDSDGWYQCPLTATDTDTLGPLTVQITMSGALPVWKHYVVMSANVYDSMIDATDKLEVDATLIEGTDATDQINAACDTAISDAALATAANLTTVDTVVDAIKVVTDALGASAAAQLAKSAGQIISGTVDTVTNTHTPTTTEFQADDITEATADHYNGRIVIFTSGALAGQATDITDYAAVGGIGQFTVTAMTEAPADDDTFVIV